MGNECLDHFCSESEPNKENKNWMKNISNSTKIYLITYNA